MDNYRQFSNGSGGREQQPGSQFGDNMSTQPAAYASTLPYPSLFHDELARQPNHGADRGMQSNAVSQSSLASNVGNQRQNRRARFEHLDWQGWKSTIKDLYLGENKSLSETKEIMMDRHSFDASVKAYKDKFEEWGWRKNLTRETALAMSEISRRRKREEGKETVFTFGGKMWDDNRIENTITRTTKKAKDSSVLEDAETPKGVSYETPAPLVDSPMTGVDNQFDGDEIDMKEAPLRRAIDNSNSSVADNERGLRLTWKGRSVSDLKDLWMLARRQSAIQERNKAEANFKEVYAGMSLVQGKTSKDTVKIASELADFYVNSGRTNEALQLMEVVVRNHIELYGRKHPKTEQNILEIVELLNTWNLQSEALSLLSLSREKLDEIRDLRDDDSVQEVATNSLAEDLAELTDSINAGGDFSTEVIDYGLSIAKPHVSAKDVTVEGLLLAMVLQCQDSQTFHKQCLQSFSELLKLYAGTDQREKRDDMRQRAQITLESIWHERKWEECSEIENFEVVEAALQLTALLLKEGLFIWSRLMFGRISDDSLELFGNDDERTVWVLISIGIVYQTNFSWDEASDWFEQAFAAALAKFDPKDGIVRSLQNALDKQHFSYLTDEGKPFRTAFGATGIIITPGRLHLG